MTDSTFDAFRQAEALLAERRPLDALRALSVVLEVAGDEPSVQLLAGRAYLGSAQFQRAEEAFRKVVDLDPSDYYARFALGRTLQRQSRLTEALAQFRMAAAMNPTPEYQEALGEVSARLAVERDRRPDR
ncbi:tetratricopeptide repeat protein [Saccharothrix violaceirubra]|uniref:Tetratricopeptide (TPR) repeat protein n=1 Tax=Saccharothrix violaceirubra TaxID=413306 RepID=A0A7W7T9K7_9PSEU|nr:tetratricopeptide repeat protein [Saccharothrix violaceirubra]MBB4968547.1 tetratricopeptide (TPR) repeat protein [Saccharothrix violaceirubra]